VSWIELEDWVEAIVLWTKKKDGATGKSVDPAEILLVDYLQSGNITQATFARNVRLTIARFVVLATLAHKHFQMWVVSGLPDFCVRRLCFVCSVMLDCG
jgi:hypothetical protein